MKSKKNNVVPDKIDIRDRMYQPAVTTAPGKSFIQKTKLPILNQKETSACTGFALATVVNFLVRKIDPANQTFTASPFMLYSMARRYDEFPGYKKDEGSSLRGAIKGWHKHGACENRFWKSLEMPKPDINAEDGDWWLNSVNHPLGAYYRVEPKSIEDMHCAINDLGVLYASAICHAGWDHPRKSKDDAYAKIPNTKVKESDGGHAFVIIGYNQTGFIIQNSWGKTWGTDGLAVLTYEDWQQNAMDCWVAQIGVTTDLHLTIAKSSTLRVDSHKKVAIATDPILKKRELDPFIIDMENNGMLSNSGEYRTTEMDIEALVSQHAGIARQRWGLKNKPMDVAIYAHGGLVGEKSAADSYALWCKKLYDAQIFPIMLMWETDIFNTVKNMIEDTLLGQEPRATAGFLDRIINWKDERLERLAAPLGLKIWKEMKENAKAISYQKNSGGQLLYKWATATKSELKSHVNIHLIGHSAGSIVHSHLVEKMISLGWNFKTVQFMAPAVTNDLFDATILKAINSKKVGNYYQYHLSDEVELKDNCSIYSKSLLYLVSNSFEPGRKTPLLGMEKYFKDEAKYKLSTIKSFSSPGASTKSTSHGGFDNDVTTIETIIKNIKR
ncbi:peptidase C1A papain [Lacibacter luteus]|uniref:Peptidase C1A papain n=1 Tax=Lacibacter luteus TaxID=2508719 RepID=A0A4Q1CM15_9BACT|nr:C1 family peptidase [Lacibacter luteus]RXK61711.1 peptidase C1A papain [Lacibacter luteus]